MSSHIRNIYKDSICHYWGDEKSLFEIGGKQEIGGLIWVGRVNAFALTYLTLFTIYVV